MANYKVGQRIKLRSGRMGTIRTVLIDSSIAQIARYQVAMEPGRELIGVNGLDVLEILTPVDKLPPNVHDAALSIRAFASWRQMNMALRDLDEIMCSAKVKYVLQGSSAALLHGAVAPEIPDDLDVCVDNLFQAAQALTAPTFLPRPGGTHAVHKFSHSNGTKIDVVLGPEFGVNIGARTSVQGVWVLTLLETLIGILIRPEQRAKEYHAFNSLILLKGNLLTPPEKAKLLTTIKNMRNMSLTWDQLVELAKKANTHFKLGVADK